MADIYDHRIKAGIDRFQCLAVFCTLMEVCHGHPPTISVAPVLSSRSRNIHLSASPFTVAYMSHTARTPPPWPSRSWSPVMVAGIYCMAYIREIILTIAFPIYYVSTYIFQSCSIPTIIPNCFAKSHV